MVYAYTLMIAMNILVFLLYTIEFADTLTVIRLKITLIHVTEIAAMVALFYLIWLAQKAAIEDGTR